jgi:MoaA/NifB/PqqE/SkfB family radical SAM enzyme
MAVAITRPPKSSCQSLNLFLIKGGRRVKQRDCLYRCTYISPSGDVTPCCALGSPILGNVKSNGQGEVWKSEAYSDFVRRFFLKILFSAARVLSTLICSPLLVSFEISLKIIRRIHDDNWRL